jgi:hypothetical protein
MVFSVFGEEPAGKSSAYPSPGYKLSPQVAARPKHGPQKGIDSIRRWNEIAINASGVDHTPVVAPENRVFGEQLGPARASRAIAIVHIAMFDTINAVLDRYESYTGIRAKSHNVSMQAAISQAAHDTLVALFPSQSPNFNQWLAEDLADANDNKQKANGIDLGRQVAARILAMRVGDGSEHPEPHLGVDWVTSNLPGHWRQDPVSKSPVALGAHWGDCVPFVLQSASQFRAPPPPDMSSPQYAAAYNEVKGLGGDGITTPSTRTPDQTHIGTFWAYDGTPSLCAPPRLYNQILVQIADQMGSDAIDTARLLALANVAMADAAMGIWESKFYYDFWRPVTGIRESDPGTGPTGAGDNNAATAGDPTNTPLGAPASNLHGPNFTPPFPAYPSGHAGFGGAVFQVLRRFYETDDVPFTFVSDEFNGETRANDGTVRPYLPRTFTSFSEAEEENGQSRIYLGIHWAFDKTAGIEMGRKIGDYLFDRVFQPRNSHGNDGDN